MTTDCGTITTPTGGRIVLTAQADGRWLWLCDSCGQGNAVRREEARAQGRQHLATRYSCAHR